MGSSVNPTGDPEEDPELPVLMPRNLFIVPWYGQFEGQSEYLYPVLSPYIENAWLPILGPTAMLLIRRLATGFEQNAPSPAFTLDTDEMSLLLGVGVRGTQSKRSPLWRAIERLVHFKVALYGEQRLFIATELPDVPPHLHKYHPPTLKRYLRNNPDTDVLYVPQVVHAVD